MMTETWFGLVQTPRDAYLLLEACRLGLLYRITRRLTDLERSQIIRPGAVFVWEEKEAGIKRWTDHVRWSPSRVSGAFLIYSELLSASSRDNHPHASDPLLKQSFSSTTVDGDRLHLIAYYSKAALDSGQLPTPSADDRLRSIVIPPGIYPDHRATGGVEDQTSRDRQRVNLIPRSPATSFKTFDSSPSSNSLKANIPLLDASHLQATNAAVLSETTTEARTSLDTVGNSASPKGVLYHKKAVESRYPATSGYLGGTLYSVDSGYIPKQTLIADNHKWGKLQQNISDWCTNGKALQSFPDSGSRTSTPCTAPSVNNAPSVQTLPPLGSWQSIEERERLNERRFSAPAKQDGAESRSSTSTTSHGFHPYCRSSDRDSEGKERRVENKGLRDSRGLSYEPSTAPGTPVTRAYTLPSIHDGSFNTQSNTTDYTQMQSSEGKLDSSSHEIAGQSSESFLLTNHSFRSSRSAPASRSSPLSFKGQLKYNEEGNCQNKLDSIVEQTRPLETAIRSVSSLQHKDIAEPTGNFMHSTETDPIYSSNEEA
ncbi:Gti1/Pac2 family-domain-containing protein [Phakopsora pachyrhizi]|nr:Gti1/Pac2 family-domain-containing protein [Phakopsora pachyrhizi]